MIFVMRDDALHDALHICVLKEKFIKALLNFLKRTTSQKTEGLKDILAQWACIISLSW